MCTVMQGIKWKVLVFLSGLLASWGAYPAADDNYPNKRIRLVVPYPSGSGSDLIGRILAQRLLNTFGYPMIVDNRPGASGITGVEIVAGAAPDGYTLVMATSAVSIYPNMQIVPYDIINDFSPVVRVAGMSFILAVSPTLPVNSVKELISLARSDTKQQLNYASSGPGSPPHLTAELFKSMAGVDMVNVSYKGTAVATADVVSGRVQVVFTPVAVALPFIKSGRLKALAVTSARRISFVPELPTVSESGVPGFEMDIWYGIFSPKGTQPKVINLLNEAVLEQLKTREVKEQFATIGTEPIGSTPDQLASLLRAEIAKYAVIVKKANIKKEN